jgi:HPt (histidine-containing phosphotransfer) domain-containing protein
MELNMVERSFRHAGAPKDPKATRKLMASLWERNLPVLRDRVVQLEHAVVAARAGTMTQMQRADAISTAHKLAGSLGMFGYSEGTEFARRIEQHLETSGPVDALRFGEDVAAMQAALSL